MARIAQRLVLGAVALGLTTFVLPTARAAGETIRDGCLFAAVATHPTEFNSAAEGVIADVSLTTDAAGDPIFATVSCKIEVNGVDATPTFSYSGTGVQVGVDLLSFVTDEGDSVSICQRVVYDTGAATAFGCRPVTEARVPPEQVTDLVAGVFHDAADPVICGVLGGDVALPPNFAYTGPVYDCPPYDTSPTDGPVNTTNGPYAELYFALPPGVDD